MNGTPALCSFCRRKFFNYIPFTLPFPFIWRLNESLEARAFLNQANYLLLFLRKETLLFTSSNAAPSHLLQPDTHWSQSHLVSITYNAANRKIHVAISLWEEHKELPPHRDYCLHIAEYRGTASPRGHHHVDGGQRDKLGILDQSNSWKVAKRMISLVPPILLRAERVALAWQNIHLVTRGFDIQLTQTRDRAKLPKLCFSFCLSPSPTAWPEPEWSKLAFVVWMPHSDTFLTLQIHLSHLIWNRN